MARRKPPTLRERRDQLRAKVADARSALHELERRRHAAAQEVEVAHAGYVTALAATGDPGKGDAEAEQRLQEAQANAHGGAWDAKVEAADRIVREREAEVELLLRERGHDLIEELRAEATAIPEEWQALLNRVRELGAKYDGISTEVGAVLSAQGSDPKAVPVNPVTAILHELDRTPTIPPPLPHAPSGLIATTPVHGPVLTPGPAAFVSDDEAPKRPGRGPVVEVFGGDAA